MFLEAMTIVMLFLLIILKYGVVTRIVKLNQRLREAEAVCKRHEGYLQRRRSERVLAEREESNLTRQQISLEAEMKRLEGEWGELKEANSEVLQELLPEAKLRQLREMQMEKSAQN